MEDSIYRIRHQDMLTLCVLALLCLGIVMVQSAAINVATRWEVLGQGSDGVETRQTVEATSRAQAIQAGRAAGIEVTEAFPTEAGWRWTDRGSRHILFAVVALGAFLLVGHLDYRTLIQRQGTLIRHPVFWMLCVSIFACAIVLVPGIGREVNGARRWLPLGFTQVQPSELGKWAIVLFLAWWLSARPLDLNRFRNVLFTLLPIGLICLLIVIQDFGTAALIGLASMMVLLAGRVKLWHLAVIIPPAIGLAITFIAYEPYRLRRLMAFTDPWASPRGEGYHMIQSLLSFSTGGITGKGLGNGIQKLGYLPEDTTDFIFAVICEELGLFGAMLTLSLYLGIIYVAWRLLKQKRDSFGRLLAFGIGTMIGLQAMINVAVATVSVPTKGLSLPLVSAGGSGLVITCAALGVLYSVARHRHRPDEQDTKAPQTAPPVPRQRVVTAKVWDRFTAPT